MGEGVGAYYSDEYQDFLAFKKATGGVLHQHKRVKLDEWHQDEIAAMCPELKIIAHEETIKDKRCKGGERKETRYTYEYYGKEYTLRELNKKGMWITIDIRFDTLLDLIPYYPYLVSFCYSSDGKQTVYVSDESFVDEERDEHLERGWYSDFWQHYKKELQDHYRDVVLKYFNPAGRERIEEIEFGFDGIGMVSRPIDENFRVEWRWADGKIHTHWTSPEVIDAASGEIRIHENDLKMLGDKMLVYYVEAKRHELDLG